MSDVQTELTEDLFNQLQKEKFVVLGTVDAETGGPTTNAISWVYAVNPSTIRFAVDVRSRIVRNVQEQPQVTLSFFGSGALHAVYGKVRTVSETLEEVPFKLACFDIDVSAVRNAMFYGSRITVEPEYEKTYDARAAAKLDNQVFAAMKKA